jgi:hypothetical protein
MYVCGVAYSRRVVLITPAVQLYTLQGLDLRQLLAHNTPLPVSDTLYIYL